jgi:hypothetical protein
VSQARWPCLCGSVCEWYAVGKAVTPLHFSWHGQVHSERCDWRLASRRNIDLSFVTVICSMKSSINNKKSSPVLLPELINMVTPPSPKYKQFSKCLQGTRQDGEEREDSVMRRLYNSGVCMVMKNKLDCQEIGVRVPVGERFFFSTTSVPILGPIQPLIQWVLGANSTEPEADHLLATSSEVKNTSICMSTTPIRLHGVVQN